MQVGKQEFSTGELWEKKWFLLINETSRKSVEDFVSSSICARNWSTAWYCCQWQLLRLAVSVSARVQRLSARVQMSDEINLNLKKNRWGGERRSGSRCCHQHETLISQSVITSLALFQSLIIILGNDHKQNEGEGNFKECQWHGK